MLPARSARAGLVLNRVLRPKADRKFSAQTLAGWLLTRRKGRRMNGIIFWIVVGLAVVVTGFVLEFLTRSLAGNVRKLRSEMEENQARKRTHHAREMAREIVHHAERAFKMTDKDIWDEHALGLKNLVDNGSSGVIVDAFRDGTTPVGVGLRWGNDSRACHAPSADLFIRALQNVDVNDPDAIYAACDTPGNGISCHTGTSGHDQGG